MTYYVPTSTGQLIHTVMAGDPGRRHRLRADWPALTEALSRLLVANHLSVPQEWRTES
jgi:hypothetical protein